MPRLAAIAWLCVVFSISAIASGEEGSPTDGPIAEAAATGPLADLSPEVLKELEPEEIDAILAVIDASESMEDVLENTDWDVVGLLVPIALFLTILLGVVSTQVHRTRKQAQLHQTLRLMIEKGSDIPPELFAPPNAAQNDLRRGLALVGVGLALLILIGLEEGFASGGWAVGLVPAFIGAAYLIVWRYSQRAENR